MSIYDTAIRFDPHTHETKKALENTRSSLVLGVLAHDVDRYPSARDHYPITVNSKGTGILMYIRPISKEPEIISLLDNYLSSPLYVGKPKEHLGSHLPPSFKYESNHDRQVEILKQKFENKVFLFRPRITYLDNTKIFKNFEIAGNLEEWKEGTEYEPVPKITNLSSDEFELKLQQGESILLKDFDYNKIGPQYVICDDFLYYFKNGWASLDQKQWAPHNVPAITKTNVEWFNHFIFGTESLWFIDTAFLTNIPAHKWESIATIHAEDEKETPVETFDTSSSKQSAPQTAKMSDKPSSHEEHQFLEHLWNITRENGLYYSMDTLVNFHISVKTNPVTILSGMSGTGKTRLALLYAEALGLYSSTGLLEGEKNRMLVIPISPAYTEPDDLMGHLNASTNLYVPSDTGFADFLIQAQNDEQNMYMVIFDEMNLSQVEHWFAPFISRLELTEELKELQLYSSNQVCHNNAKYPPTVRLGNNLLFIGTANLDETTRNFSDRLLDRVNIVVPEKISFKEFFEARVNNRDEDDDYGSELSDKYRNRDVYRGWASGFDVWNAFTVDEMDFFEGLHRIINDADPQKGVSFRALKKIAEYIKAIPLNGENQPYLDRRLVIDLQVKQRILTKIRGSSEQFRDLIGVAADGVSTINGQLFAHFTDTTALSMSDFSNTMNEIRRKARELHMYDYAT
ncbi:AAA domain-containing protein (plasmid) [Paenibacillus rhizovicinus]|uniref:AAA domain-containing protein n=1 Tax=Paenibacillus rhizovicinus TaxID=2704463 RepID=A0A6C0PAB9_9BACL|nr:AAA family ATPase [Paenibacillus rhizovicinus]QHW35478.1 AAA domain-containing protein [Paenibacillus rhizovicinus]